MPVDVTYASTVTVAETIGNNTGSAAATSRVVTHNQFNEAGTYSAGTTPPVTQCAHFIATLSGGALVVDLRALQGTNGATVDGLGLRVQMLRVKNLGASPLTIKSGASNPYSIGAGLVIPAGGHVTMFMNDGIADISGTVKTIDLTGTGAETSEWTIVLG